MSTTPFFSMTAAILEELRESVLDAHVQDDLPALLKGVLAYLDRSFLYEVEGRTQREHCRAVVTFRLNEFQDLVKGRDRADAEHQFDELLSVLHGVSRQERAGFYRRWGISAQLMASYVTPPSGLSRE